MNEVGYNTLKIKSKFIRGRVKRKEYINSWFRKQGIKVGEKCSIFSNIMSSEPYLISIGDNVTISNDVQLITHDNSIIKVSKAKYTDIFGKISIGNNCFIGAHSLIMPGVKVCDNVIVAAGSVVTKSITEPYSIIGGNPARIIGDWNTYLEKNDKYGLNVAGMSYEDKKNYLQKHHARLK